jgi:outer membrane protein assembly factor BamB
MQQSFQSARVIIQVTVLLVSSGLKLPSQTISLQRIEEQNQLQSINNSVQDALNLSSTGSMVGVTPQRTRAYDSRDLSTQPSKQLWASGQLFTLQDRFYAEDTTGLVGHDIAYPSDHKYSAPIFSDGVIYVTAYNGNSYILVLDARTGSKILQYQIDKTALSSVAIARGIAYVGGNNGRFYAIDIKARTGKSLILRKDYRFDLSSPVVTDGIVYFTGAKEALTDTVRPEGILLSDRVIQRTRTLVNKTKRLSVGTRNRCRGCVCRRR